MRFGLKDDQLELIRAVFKGQEGVLRVVVFGSRALETHEASSDVDLAVQTSKDADDLLVARLATELDALPLALQFDVIDLGRVEHAGLREHITRHGQLLYPAGT